MVAGDVMFQHGVHMAYGGGSVRCEGTGAEKQEHVLTYTGFGFPTCKVRV